MMNTIKQTHCRAALCFVALGAVSLLACGSADDAPKSDVDEPVATTEQSIIPGSAVTQVSNSFLLPANGALSNVGVMCPSGSIIIGGGHSSGHSGAVVYQSRKRPLAQGWGVSAINLSTTNETPVNVYAECLSGTNAYPSVVTTSIAISPGGSGTGSIACPTGTILSGGGYNGSDISFDPYSSYPSSQNGQLRWAVGGKNRNSGAGITFTVQAICLGGVTGQSTVRSAVTNFIPVGSRANINSMPCPSGTLLGSGGYMDPFVSTIRAYGNFRSILNPSVWTIAVENISGSSTYAWLPSTCLELWP